MGGMDLGVADLPIFIVKVATEHKIIPSAIFEEIGMETGSGSGKSFRL